MEALMERCLDRWIGGKMKGCYLDEWLDVSMDGWMDESFDVWMKEWTDGWKGKELNYSIMLTGGLPLVTKLNHKETKLITGVRLLTL